MSSNLQILEELGRRDLDPSQLLVLDELKKRFSTEADGLSADIDTSIPPPTFTPETTVQATTATPVAIPKPAESRPTPTIGAPTQEQLDRGLDPEAGLARRLIAQPPESLVEAGAEDFFSQVDRFVAGDEISLDDKDLAKKFFARAGRELVALPFTLTIGLANSLLTDPRATAVGFAEGINESVNNFAILQSPESTPEQRKAAKEYMINNPFGLAFTTAILTGAGKKIAGRQSALTEVDLRTTKGEVPLDTAPTVPKAEPVVEARPSQNASQQGSVMARTLKAPADAFMAVQRYHSEGMADRVARVGGENSKVLANLARETTSEAHGIIGQLEVKSLDAGLKATGKANRATRWLNALEDAPGGKYGQIRLRRIAETNADVPEFARDTYAKWSASNLDIGKVAEPASPGFKAMGRPQRIPTPERMDIIGKGRDSPDFNTLVDAHKFYAPEIPREAIARSFLEVKTFLDAGDWESAFRTMNQEHIRLFPDVPSYITIGTGMRVPLYHDLAFDYLRNASQRTAMRTSFLNKFGEDKGVALMEKARSEMPSTEAKAVDDLVRTLHGIPIDQITTGRIGYAARLANETITSIFSPLALSASAIPNVIELGVGQTVRNAGYRNYLRGATALYKNGREGIESMGAINKAIFDYSSNPFSAYRTGLKRFRNTAHRVTLNNALNELQEALSASTAEVMRQDMQAGKFNLKTRNRYEGILKDWGFDKDIAVKMVNGRGTQNEYTRFVRRAAAVETGGNRLPAEGSRLQNSRISSSLFKFQTYPIVQANAIAGPAIRMVEGQKTRNMAMRNAGIRQFVKQLGFTTASGAGIIAVKALMSGGEEGLGIRISESQDEFDEFLADAFLNGLGGPLSMISWGLRRAETSGLGDVAFSMTFPGSIVNEMNMFIRGTGPYGITDNALERGRIYLERTPAGKILSTWAGSVSYGSMKPADRAAISAYYRWKRDVKIRTFVGVGGEDEQKEFASAMRRLSNAIKSGDSDAASLAVQGVFDVPTDEDPSSRMAASLRARMLLTSQALGVDDAVYYERLDALKKRIGRTAYARLETHDALLGAWADALK